MSMAALSLLRSSSFYYMIGPLSAPPTFTVLDKSIQHYAQDRSHQFHPTYLQQG